MHHWHEIVTDDPASAEVEWWGRGLYWVQSRSRGAKRHLVDFEGREFVKIFEPTYCECEAFKFHHQRPCFHLIAALFYAIDILPVDTKRKTVALKIFQRTNDVLAALASLRKIEEKPKRGYELDKKKEKRYEPKQRTH